MIGFWLFEAAGELTVAQICEVLPEFRPEWRKGTFFPEMYVGIDDDDLAKSFRDRFGIEPVQTPDSTEDDILRFYSGV